MATRPEVNRPDRSTPDRGVPSPTTRPATPRSRAGAAWVGIVVAATVLVALVVFMLQNTQPVLISFFTLEGSLPLALALLIAAVGVSLVALVIGSVRIGQLRRRLKQERREHA